MSQVQLVVTFNINTPPPPPPPNPLQVSPAAMTFPDLTVGVAIPNPVKIATISGGSGGYAIAPDPNSAPTPPGLNVGIDTDGVSVVVSGTPTVAGQGDVTYNITDGNGASAQLKTNAKVSA